MSERYAALLAIWKQADETAKQAERRLNERFEAFLAGNAPEPTDEERAEVARLREEERLALDAALAYVRKTAYSEPR